MNAYIQFDKIDGESADSAHKKWIEPLKFSFSVKQAPGGDRGDAGPVARSRANFGDFTILKNVDATSPTLFLKCANCDKIDSVILDVCRDVGTKETVYRVKMENVFVMNVSPEGSKDGIPTEKVELNYGKINYKYVVFSDDNKQVDVKSAWDRSENAEISYAD